MKAMILAAGRGERMRPYTDTVPKPLLQVGGTPLICRILQQLARSGFREVIINVSHLAAAVEAAVGDGAPHGVRVAYSREAVPLETAGGIAWALPFLGEAPFLVVNGDLFSDFDFARARGIARLLDARSKSAYLVLVDNPPHHPQGDFSLGDDGTVGEDGPRLTFSGIGIYRPALFAHVVRGAKHALAPLLREAIGQEKVIGEHYRGRWFDVGTPERLAAVNALHLER